MVRRLRQHCALVLLVTAFAWPASGKQSQSAVQAEASYFDGLERYRGRDFVGAMDAFERALEQGPSPSLSARALQAFVRSALELSPVDPETACGRLQPRRDAIRRLSSADEAGRQALRDLQTMDARCAPPEPDTGLDASGRPLPRPTPPTRPDHAPAIGLTIGAGLALAAGAAFYGLTWQAVDARDAAGQRFAAADSEAARVTAARAVGYHDGQAEARRLTGAVLLGTGGALAVAAIWAWADPPETLDVPFALRVGPGGIGIGGAF